MITPDTDQLERRYQTYRQALADQVRPLAWVDMDLLDANIAAITARAENKPIRIASKSIRSEYILKYILDSDEQFQGLMCYHPAEAAYLAERGFDNLLIAYPSMNRPALLKALEKVQQQKTLYFMVDSLAQVELINELAAQQGVRAKLCMDLDMSVRYPGIYFGVYRSPIKSAEDAVRLYKEIRHFEQVELNALMGYEAQIAGLGDQIPGKGPVNTVVNWLKQHSIPMIAERRESTVRALQAAGAQLDIVNGGGTGSIESTIKEAAVTEVTVGSGFYCSHRFDHYRQFRHEPAAGFALEVVRQPDEQRLTCAGGGYIASGSSEALALPMPYLPTGLKLEKNEGAGEVQTPVRGSSEFGQLLSVGDTVFFRHSKAGELCERFNELYLLRDGKLFGKAKTYRGQGLCFE